VLQTASFSDLHSAQVPLALQRAYLPGDQDLSNTHTSEDAMERILINSYCGAYLFHNLIHSFKFIKP
jgi:hypothetical protein